MRAAILCALLAACGGGALARAPGAGIPTQTVGEPTDEWLYAHCAVKRVAALAPDAIDAAARAAGATFVEVLYAEPGATDVVMFACTEQVPL